jgi:DNA polymerase III alpha subunit
MELDVLNTSITYPLVFNGLDEGKPCVLHNCKVTSVVEKTDRNGRLMAFVKVNVDGVENVEVVAFASKYIKVMDLFNEKNNYVLEIKGKKDKNKLILDKVSVEE